MQWDTGGYTVSRIYTQYIDNKLNHRDPFVMPISDQQRVTQNKIKLRFSNGVPSDQLVVLNALCGYEGNRQRGESGSSRYCDDNFLSRSTMGFVVDLHRQVSRCLEGVTGISGHKHHYTKRNNENVPLKCALVGIGLSCNVAMRKKGTSVFLTEKGVKAKVHPSSINKKQGSVSAFPDACSKNVEIIGYQELVAAVSASSLPGSASLNMLGTCPLSVFTFLLSCGCIDMLEVPRPSDDDDDDDGEPSPAEEMVDLVADHWLQLRTPKSTALLILGVRECLYDALCCMLRKPDDAPPAHVWAVVEGIVAAFSTEHFMGRGLSNSGRERGGAGAGASSSRGPASAISPVIPPTPTAGPSLAKSQQSSKRKGGQDRKKKQKK